MMINNETKAENKEAQQQKEVTKIETKPVTIGQFLLSKKTEIEKALPKHMTADKILRNVMTEITRNPDLKKCSAESLVTAIIQSSLLGLHPDSLTGEAYLIPYNNSKKGIYECQFQVGYKGMLRLAYNSGQILYVDAQVVHENDEFFICFGTEKYLKFIPALKNRGEVKCYYAIAYMKNGGSQFAVMSKEDVDKHKAYSKASNSNYSPWFTHYDEMAKKTCIKSVLKYLPRNSEDLNLIVASSLDDQSDLGTQDNSHVLIDEETGEVLKQERRVEQLVGALKK
jgi:recombination protein RecT